LAHVGGASGEGGAPWLTFIKPAAVQAASFATNHR